MAENINMDLKKPSNNDGPQLEFSLPVNEVGQPVTVGDHGMIMVPVEVTQVTDGMVSFRKRGKAQTQGNFRETTLEEDREDIGVAER